MLKTNLDLDVLRTFVTGIQLGSFAKAADHLARSPSAVSAQLQKLQAQLGTPVFQKSGRGLKLTSAGDSMLVYAQRLLQLNDEALAAMHAVEVAGSIRFGLQEDFGEILLPEILANFAKAHRQVVVEARVARNAELLERVASGNLDMALVWGDGAGAAGKQQLAQIPMAWIGAKHVEYPKDFSLATEAIPFIAFDPPCSFRSMATDALDAANIGWRTAFTSASLGGLFAATKAGFGITVRTAICLPPELIALDPKSCHLPALPSIALTLVTAQSTQSTLVKRLADIVIASLAEPIAAIR
ncbi:LysR substrate-binding domain-containing protein [Glaciimonas soli]|uniref:LysR family transcriptional regulator n=1 Tax=Glaciimonas soli TaxID=2590999 RepID=A0A843YSG1_9BURK|nr:LysR substrate-binding domain-containing protein [Glaciimonas soli]MQR02505.1 LysR family transcriptional regulator [Glaciimonas soli]